MLVHKPERMAGFVPNDAVKLPILSLHGESLKVHRGFTLLDGLDLRAYIGPITAVLAARARDAHVGVIAVLGGSEGDVGVLVPCVHVAQNPVLERGFWTIQKSDRQLHAARTPVSGGQQRNVQGRGRAHPQGCHALHWRAIHGVDGDRVMRRLD